MAANEHLSLGRIAKLCNVSRTTVYRWIVNEQLHAYSLPSGHFRVKPEDLSDFCRAYQIPDPFASGAAQQRSASESGDSGSGNESLGVLIADDHPDMVDVLEKVVQRFLPEAEIHIARNGVETCMQVATVRPRILLLDIMMPGMDGFTVLQELLARSELDHSQVVVVSAYDPFDRVEALEHQYPQVRACFRKPVSIDKLGGTLQELAKTTTPRNAV